MLKGWKNWSNCPRTNAYWVLTGMWWCALTLIIATCMNWISGSVIYQEPRPGPPLPKGESYLTIGWKQVCRNQHHGKDWPTPRRFGLRQSSTRDCHIPSYTYSVSFCLRMCVLFSLIDLYWFLFFRAWTRLQRSLLFVRMISFSLVFCRTHTLVSRKL